MKLLLSFFIAYASYGSTDRSIVIFNGFVSKIHCEGKLLISAVGDPKILFLEALPPQIGCGVLIKPLVQSGRTNLVLETTSGSVSAIIEISPPKSKISTSQLEFKLRALE